TEAWFDIQRSASCREIGEGAQAAMRVDDTDRALMFRPAQQRVAYLERRRRGRRQTINGQDLGVNERVGAAHRQTPGRPRIEGELAAASERVRDVVCLVLARVAQRTPDRDQQIVVAVEESGGADDERVSSQMLFDAAVDAAAALG